MKGVLVEEQITLAAQAAQFLGVETADLVDALEGVTEDPELLRRFCYLAELTNKRGSLLALISLGELPGVSSTSKTKKPKDQNETN